MSINAHVSFALLRHRLRAPICLSPNFLSRVSILTRLSTTILSLVSISLFFYFPIFYTMPSFHFSHTIILLLRLYSPVTFLSYSTTSFNLESLLLSYIPFICWEQGSFFPFPLDSPFSPFLLLHLSFASSFLFSFSIILSSSPPHSLLLPFYFSLFIFHFSFFYTPSSLYYRDMQKN
jgi:hypothetical protein